MEGIDKNKQDQEKLSAAKAAFQFVKNNDVVGLGTGSTATFAIEELAKRIQAGLKIKAAASSVKTEELALSLGIPILKLETLGSIDISIDGADEFTESLNLIKGGGGALFREKIIASLSKNSIIITDSSKKVDRLGAFTVPVEVVPLALQYVLNQLAALNGKAVLRKMDEKTFVSDNGNYIVDVDFGLLDKPEELALALNQIDGLLAHGLFIGLTSKVIMAKGDEILVFE
ncbi:ribose-5-phosphate isomerase RpiA [Pedobacter jejuensis]|uniref:Ribose-5-phosphate isomerase A n=1 Tax=Pedobacter jejuensis TaxID=1268550 RepID=A0A3N0C059_9SPHI|nr:ribose-5-phosphate isomerase RpiA [Pedobacter jejuensis]RNL55546.1 ribose-5-phosphate isomerase RpiA [Pedobacter jejuensis]